MKKFFSILMAVAMLACAAIPVMAADPAVPVAKSGDKIVTGVTANGEWSVTDEAVTATGQNNMFVITNDSVEAGKVTATIDRTTATSTGHDGIIFCASEGSNKFWESEIGSYYFLFVEGGNGKLGLVKGGKHHGNWNSNAFKERYEIPEEDRTGVYTISAEWDCTGTIKCYLNGELVMTHTDSNPLSGSRYGMRAASVGVSYTSVVAEAAAPAENAIRNGKADAIPGTVTVDGVIDEAWEKAPVYTMENVVVVDSKNENGVPTETESSKIDFRVMYGDGKVYMLFEIEDNEFINAASETNWKNDALFIYLSEDGLDRGQKSDKSTTLCAFLENYAADKSDRTGLIVRSGKGANDKPKEHAVKIDGNKAVMEISIQFNTITPEEGGFFVMDLQYNDNDDTSGVRSITWAWSCAVDNGPNNNANDSLGWGTVNFVAEPACKHTNTEVKGAKEATETEEGYTGDKVCKDCGETVETGKKIPATGTQGGEVKPAPTGDVTLAVSVLALAAVAGAVVISRRRKV